MAVAVNQLGLVEDSGLDAAGTSVTAYAAIVAAPLALLDAGLSGLLLHKACRSYQTSRQALAERSSGMARFDETRFRFEQAQEKITHLRQAIASIRRDLSSDESQVARTDRTIATLGAELKLAEAEQTRLHRELCGLAPDAQQAANAQANFAESRVALAELSVNAARSVGGLVASSMQASQGWLEVTGRAASGGFQAATDALGYTAGGLSILTGGVAVGLASYRLHKTSQSKAQIQAALSAAKGKTNDELINEVGAHAIARKDQARRRSFVDIFKSSLSIAGGVIGLVALSATGVGALVLGATALGLGVTVACASVGQIMAQRREGRLDNALRAQVADEASREHLLDAVKNGIMQAREGEPEGTEAGFDIDYAAKLMLAARNPFYAVQLLGDQIQRPADDAEHQQAITFLRDAGMPEAEQRRLSLLLTDSGSEASRQLALRALETFLLG